MMREEIIYLVALQQFSKFGPIRLKKLSSYFPTIKTAYLASVKELVAAGLEKNLASEFVAARNDIDPNKVWAELEQENINIITYYDDNYPKLLKEIYDAPFLLYYKGQMKQDEFALAVVGTRKFTHYGQSVTENIVADLVKNNLTIISGLALGIDSIAHQVALQNQGRTIAVLGTGLDRKSLYPSINRYLADKIVASDGLILTEFPLGMPPLKHNFPQRNRIISGLSLGTLLIEAGEKSGALITARHALDQNREVFAVPGNIFSPVSIGPNNLIKLGAKAVTSAQEILEALDLVKITNYIENKKIIPQSPEEELIVAHLSHEPRHVDELIRLSGLSAPLVSSTLTMMEMKGAIKNIGSMQYVLVR